MNQPYDPTPAEIEIACERIRASWTPKEHERRSAWATEQRQVEILTVAVEVGVELGSDA